MLPPGTEKIILFNEKVVFRSNWDYIRVYFAYRVYNPARSQNVQAYSVDIVPGDAFYDPESKRTHLSPAVMCFFDCSEISRRRSGEYSSYSSQVNYERRNWRESFVDY